MDARREVEQGLGRVRENRVKACTAQSCALSGTKKIITNPVAHAYTDPKFLIVLHELGKIRTTKFNLGAHYGNTIQRE